MAQSPNSPAESQNDTGKDKDEKTLKIQMPDVVYVGQGIHRPWDMGGW
jgi:hypothetical protein